LIKKFVCRASPEYFFLQPQFFQNINHAIYPEVKDTMWFHSRPPLMSACLWYYW